ncbi:NAD-glutamate dehydrogenase [Thioploca ingrica]|uniref:NAD-glutamate dehydrogenase n=1 Tax=Thioploca ingrica TaxID=40754 RepID=A0A090AN88_9GAMM|nr:NAD-glutamate dehydrogenase [Thioploca ingrica]
MALNSKDQAAELLEKIIARVDNHFFGVESAQIKSFIQYFYHAVTPEEILTWGDSVNLYHVAIFYWHWIHQYSPHQPKVQVYNPQLEPVGWQSSYTIVSILVKEQPFLVDSLQMALNRQGLRIHLGIYLTLKTYRDEQGQLVDIFPADSNKLISPESIHAESLIHIARRTPRELSV